MGLDDQNPACPICGPMFIGKCPHKPYPLVERPAGVLTTDQKPAAGPREPKRLWAYRGKISEKEGIRTAISWDGPPSPAYTCFVPESYADELKRECEKYKASYMDCLSSLSSEKDYGGELKREKLALELQIVELKRLLNEK